MTLAFTAKDTYSAINPGVKVATAAVTVNGTAGANAPTAPSGTTLAGVTGNYSATYVMSASDNDGAVATTAVVYDVLGNSSTLTAATGMTFDKTVPTVAVSSISVTSPYTPGWANLGKDIVLTYTVTESHMGVTTVVLADKTTNPTPTSASPTTATTTVTAAGVGGNPILDGTVAYSVTSKDLAGNTTGPITVTVDTSAVTVDRVAPVVTISNIISNHSGYTAFAKATDTITMTYKVVEASMPSTVTVALAGNTTTPSAPTTNVSTTAAQVVDVSTYPASDGVVAYSVSLTDLAGNSGSSTNTTDSSTVTVDRQGPTLALTSYSSNNGTTPASYAAAGNTVTLAFTAKDTYSAINPGVKVATAAVTVNGTAGANAPTAPSGTTLAGVTGNYSATYVMSASDNDGAVATTAVVYDVLGNSSTLTAATGMTFDKTAPTLLPSESSSYPKSSSGIIHLSWKTPTDTGFYATYVSWAKTADLSTVIGFTTVTGSSNTTYTYDTPILTDTTGYTIYYKSIDKAGNISTTSLSNTQTVSGNGSITFSAAPTVTLDGNGHPIITYLVSAGIPTKLLYWLENTVTPTTTVTQLTSVTTPSFTSPVDITGISPVTNDVLAFCLADASSTSVTFTYTYNGSVYVANGSRAIQISSASGANGYTVAGGKQRFSSSSSPLSDPSYNISFSNPSGSRAAQSPTPLNSSIVYAPILGGYPPMMVKKVNSSGNLAPSIDTTSLSLLQRGAKASTSTTVRYSATESTLPSAQAQGMANAGSAPTTPAASSTSAAPTQAPAKVPISSKPSGARAAAPANEPLPANPKPSAPTENSLPRPDLFVGQTREDRDDASDTWDDSEESDTLNGEESV